MVKAAVEKLDSIGNILHTVQHLGETVTQPLSSSTVTLQRLKPILWRCFKFCSSCFPAFPDSACTFRDTSQH